MIKRVLLYNSGGGIGDSIQILRLIETLKSELKDTKLFYLSAHENHFNNVLKDYNCEIETLNLKIKYFYYFYNLFIRFLEKIHLFSIYFFKKLSFSFHHLRYDKLELFPG